MLTPQQKSARARERAESPTREAIQFAARSRLLRRALGLTQSEFAQRLGRTNITVCRWEALAGYAPSKESMRRFVEIEYEEKIRRGDPAPKLRIGG